jgi:hypothetical protein
LEIAREQAQYDALQAELRRESEVVQIDFERAELLSRKVMASRSQKLKEMLSELLLRMGEEMLSGSEVRLRDKAAAALAINSIGKSLFGWDREADINEMERVSSHPLTHAVNLELIATSPAELRRLGELNWAGWTMSRTARGSGQGAKPGTTPEPNNKRRIPPGRTRVVHLESRHRQRNR